ncbi:unannotated protein [freshwater metagenome]|uniref:Unannotated protein n=1 Tax=freshwater metagenome TaxID=449393 RepID=A0A6J6HAN6_9ZZZZ
MAVGTVRLFSILVTMAAPTPRNGSSVDPSGTGTTGAADAVGVAAADARVASEVTATDA